MVGTWIVVVSDTHLSRNAPEANTNWEAVLRHVADTKPDLVVHLGDLTLDGANDPDDLRDARALLDRLDAPWRAVPGNHDIGDNPWAGAPAEYAVTEERLQRWIDIIGEDRWSVAIEGWTLIAFNAQLAGSGLDEEAEQWAWLGAELAARESSFPIAVIGHKPMHAPDAEVATAPPYRYLPQEGRERLWALGSGRRIPLALSGHVHQYRRLERAGTTHVWAPTTWAVLPDEMQPTLGAKRCGILSVELEGNGSSQEELVEPEGIAQLTLDHDIPNPYGH